MKSLIIFAAIFFSLSLQAQVTKVSLQASGLTCSMCSNSINKALKTLSFVDNIDPNIQTSSFEITFKPNSDVDFDALKNKVQDAGFSVASFIATINFKDTEIKPNQVIISGGKKYLFFNVKEQSLNGLKQLKFIDKGFVSNKEYKKNAAAISATGKGIYTVVI